jgi:hypothetical protein
MKCTALGKGSPRRLHLIGKLLGLAVMEELAALSAHKAAAELNRRGIKSATGGAWYPATVLRLRERLA